MLVIRTEGKGLYVPYWEFGKQVECSGNRNMALVYRRQEQFACIVEM
jgi:hypothetical protein